MKKRKANWLAIVGPPAGHPLRRDAPILLRRVINRHVKIIQPVTGIGYRNGFIAGGAIT